MTVVGASALLMPGLAAAAVAAIALAAITGNANENTDWQKSELLKSHDELRALLRLAGRRQAQVVQYGPANRAPGAPSFSPTRIKLRCFAAYISCSAADGEAGNLGEFLRLYC